MAQAQPKRKQSPAAGSARGSLGYEEDGLDAPGRPNSSGSESSVQRKTRERAAAAAAGKTIVEEIVAVDDDTRAEAGKQEAGGVADAPEKPQQQRSLCSRMIHAIWATKLTEDLKDSTAKAKTMLRELVIYFIYLIVLSVITFGSYSSNMFRMTDALSAIFLNTPFPDFSTNNYMAIGHMGDWAVFMGQTNQTGLGSTRDVLDGPFLAGMYPNKYYNEQPIENASLGYIAFENMLLGVPRLRQVRVRNDSCKISSKYLSKLIGSCYAEFSSSAEQKSDRTPPTATNLTATAWVYSSAAVTQGSTHYGLFGTYGGGGYYQDLTRDRDTSLAIINELISSNLWLDRGTRAVFIDFTVYNPNFNLFSVVRLITEFPPVGGGLSTYVIRTVKLLRYESAEDFIIMGFEYAFCAFVFYYLVEELLEIKQVKLSYFKSFWNVMDICGLLLSLVCIAFNVYRTMAVEAQLEIVMAQPEHYVDFESLSYWQFAFNYCVGILVFISWVKVFKYLSFNRTMNQMTRTLSAAKRDLGGFMVMFFIVFFAFAQLGYLLFGSLVDDYKSLKTCIQTLLRILLGDFDYQSLKDARSLGGPFFFLFYILVVLFILFNMFMAILNDAYSEVKSNLVNEKNEFEVFDFFKDQYSAMLQKLHLKRDKIIDIQDALRGADMNDDRLVSYEEWKRELQARGYTDDEIASAFAKYDIDQNGFLDGNEQDAMMADLEAQKNAVHEEMAKVETKINRPSSARPGTSAARSEEGGATAERKGSAAKRDGESTASANGEPEKPRVVSEVSYGEFNAVARRIDRLEHSIGSIVSKIDCVLVKLEVMETAKLRRREAMTALLDSLTAGENFTEEERKRQMERLVKEELERFDSEIVSSGRPGSSASSRPGTSGARTPTGGRR